VTCDEVQQLLPSYVTGMLDADQAAAVRAHLDSGCADCLAALRETEGSLELFTESLAPMNPPPRIKAKLMAAAGDRNLQQATQPRSDRFLRYAMAASIAILLGAGCLLLIVNREMNSALAEHETQIRQLNNLLNASNLSLVELTAQKSSAHGHVLYDAAGGTWRVYIFNLDPPPANRVYELWAITTDNKKIPAGTFTVDSHGDAVCSGKVPPNLSAAAVTDEPPSGSTSPTGSIQLSGKLQS
jgi:anti-sigma-K factor RskA